ncbi:hypothetical protein [Lacinutrix sp. Hel_I_90]|uniref:hypothetical protein n=1 Tax=Lacinutrix sp. Hel_I_90 TaxID=1249999 RepID=UPI0005C866D0|nr:hypothetical protein [Lacinutrix sp. Hel_I_90]
MKTIFFKLPEYYLIVLAILAGYSPPFYVNPIFIGIVLLLMLQIIFKNRISGIILGILFFLVNLCFLGALLSELIEFSEFNNSAKQLLFVGLAIGILNLVFSATMLYTYSVNNFKRSSQIKLEKQNV